MSQFLEEIDELPKALSRMTAFYRSDGRERLNAWAEKMKSRNQVLFSGMGTSEFSPLAVQPRLSALGVAIRTVDSGEWLHYPIPLLGEQGLVVLISQSGESVEIKRLVERKMAGTDYVAITNDDHSTLARDAALVLPLCAGEEAAITTKTYTNTLGLLLLMAAAMEGDAALDEAVGHLEVIADYLQVVDEVQLAAAAKSLLPCDALGFVGRGPAIVAACQSALIFMEGARCVTSAFTGGAFRHGPFEAVGPDLRLVCFVPEGRSRAIAEGLGREAARLGARVVLVTDIELPAEENLKVVRVRNIPGEKSEDLFPLAASGTLARLLYHFAEAKGIEAGSFQYGGKVTTRE